VRRARATAGPGALRAAWALAAGLALGALFGCGTPRHDQRDFEASADHPARLGSRTLEVLTRARAALDSGDAAGAAAQLAAVMNPDAPFALRLMHQDAVLAAGGEGALQVPSAARELAEREPTATNLLLWARVAPEAAQSRAAIEHALTLDPRNPWAHYALAHARAREGDWVAASDCVQRALEIDPGHRAARRLEAAILARGAGLDDAIAALSAWLAATRYDPRVPTAWRVSAQLDLAHLHLLDGKPAPALALLREVSPAEGVELARWCLIAAAEQAAGRSSAALEAARRAGQADPRALTPMVQTALLHQHDLRDSKGAQAAWQRVLDATRGSTELASLIQGLRARIVLERAAEPAP
jgi:tetratricopeptide (TPR) repeat protein